MEQEKAAYVAELATKSLLYEVSVSPKPGLVDRFDNGAHRDMDFFTFLDSTASLSEYFRQVYLIGGHFKGDSPQVLFDRLRKPGMDAEARMYRATGGINTHKGILFTMGIFCGALGWLDANGRGTEPDAFLRFCGEMVAARMKEELEQAASREKRTGGERLFLTMGAGGVRDEAAAGFPSLQRYALPTLRRELERGASMNDAGVAVLLELLCHVKDSNLFARRGPGIQEEAAVVAREILEKEPLDLERVKEFNLFCIKENISPGGCADLLAAAFFLYFYFDDSKGEFSMENATLNLIKTRRSIRAFKGDAIPADSLDAVLEAGSYAPTGGGAQSPVIVAVTTPALREKISALNAKVMGKDTDPYYGAPVIVLVLADSARSTCVEDGSCVLENMMLAAHSLGIGSVWVHRELEIFDSLEGKALLRAWGLPETLRGVGSLALGYGDGATPQAALRKEGYILKV